MAAIAIIGGGLSGALTALHLIRMNFSTPLSVYIIDRNSRIGPGLAYSTSRLCHRMNVRAGALSLFADDPDHFVQWLFSHGGSGNADEFALRASFGRYIEEQIAKYSRQRGPSVLRFINDEAISCDIHADGGTVLLRSGDKLEVQHIVLAVGNFPPANLPAFEELQDDARYIPDPWAPGVTERLAKSPRLLFVGTGLTMVDVVLGLRENGCTAKMTALSTHGHLPFVHTSPQKYPDIYNEVSREATVDYMMRAVRRHIGYASLIGISPLAVIDSLRPHIQELWLLLPTDERRRFMRHVRHYWDSVRHRMAPECGEEIGQLVQSGELAIEAGRIVGAIPHDDTVSVVYRKRGSGDTARIEVDGIVNCTGPAQDYSRISHPLIRHLMQRGLLCADPLRIGVNALPNGRVIDRNGVLSDVLYTIGPPLRGVLWETTAVREIREQAAALASTLLNSVETESVEPEVVE